MYIHIYIHIYIVLSTCLPKLFYDGPPDFTNPGLASASSKQAANCSSSCTNQATERKAKRWVCWVR